MMKNIAAGFKISLVANAMNFLLLVPLILMSPGTSFQDMAAPFWSLLISIGALALGLPQSLSDLKQKKRYALLGVILNLMPFPLFILAVRTLIQMKGLIPEQ